VLQRPTRLPQYFQPLRQTTAAAPATPQPVFRGVPKEEDPFDRAYEMARDGGPAAKRARELVAQAEAEFGKDHFGQARLLFEQAYQADKAATDGSRDKWAYCRLRHMADGVNAGTMSLDEAERDIRATLAMISSPRVAESGRDLLAEIERRRRSESAAFPVKHYAAGSGGWQVAETAHFRIFHAQGRELAGRVAQVAERTRSEMSRKWLGQEEAWQAPCDVYLHATGQDYTHVTGIAAASPGHSKIETDPGTGRVVSRRIDLRCDNPAMLEAVLPHEATHVVLAGHFGPQPIPRWVDEGIAVLTEPAAKVDMHRRNLARSYQERDLFALRELMELPDYPQPRRITTFYAQSVSLVDFLTRRKGPQDFCQFVRDGLREGYEAALRRHYGFRDFAELQSGWGREALAGQGGSAPAYAER
jgi:hypothetical protein